MTLGIVAAIGDFAEDVERGRSAVCTAADGAGQAAASPATTSFAAR